MFYKCCLLALLWIGTLGAVEEKFLLVTGCARSGTVFTTHLLIECGLHVGHETPQQDGVVSWFMAVDDGPNFCGPGALDYHFQHTLHQVRDPLQVMSSVYVTQGYLTWDYVIRHIPQIHWSDPLIVKCAKYWYYWNLAAEKKANWTYRIEDLENQWDVLEKTLGMPLDKTAFKRVPKNINNRGPHQVEFTWELLRGALIPPLYNKIVKLAKRYGYTVEE